MKEQVGCRTSQMCTASYPKEMCSSNKVCHTTAALVRYIIPRDSADHRFFHEVQVGDVSAVTLLELGLKELPVQ